MTGNDVATTEFKMPAVKLGITDAAIKKLQAKFPAENVPDTSTKEGYEQAKGALRELVPTRTGVEKERQLLVKGANEWREKVNTKAKEITAKLEAIEKPWKDAKQAEDQRRKEEKERKEREEQERVENIECMINDIEAMLDGMVGAPVADVEARLAEVEAIDITEDVYQEFFTAAKTMRENVRNQLSQALEQGRVMAQQEEELAKRRKQQEEEQVFMDRLMRVKSMPMDMMDKTLEEMEQGAEQLQDMLQQTPADLQIPADKMDQFETAVNLAMTQLGKVISMKKTEVEQAKQDAQQREQQEEEERKALEAEAEAASQVSAQENAAYLEARLPEDIMAREYIDAMVAVDVPVIEDEVLANLVVNVRGIVITCKEQVYQTVQDAAK